MHAIGNHILTRKPETKIAYISSEKFTNELIDSIKEIEIENGITKIPADAFSNYTKLNKIILPSSLEEIGANAFANCRRLYEIYSYASIPPLAEVSSFTNYNATLYVPCEHKQYYQSDMVFSLFNKVECISSEEVETEDENVDKKDIVLFDEPELSLSIYWQENLLPDIIESGNCMFLMAVTHSPFIFGDKLQKYTIGMHEFIKK